MPSPRPPSSGRGMGCRPIPRAWLVSAGRFKGIDALRRRARFDASLAAPRRRAGRDGGERHERPGRARGRPPAADLHLLPPGPGGGRAGGAHAAGGVRPHDRGDRARLPGPAGDRGPAHRPGQGQDPRGAHPVPGPVARGAAGAARDRAAHRLPRLQRGLLRLLRALRDAAGPFRRGDPPGAPAPRAAARSRGDGAPGPDDPARVAARGADLAEAASSSCSTTRTARSGTGS